MFQAIFCGDSARLQQLGQQYCDTNNQVSALLCLEHVFIDTPQIQFMLACDLSTSLKTFSLYAWLLHDVTLVNPCTDPSMQKLFGFRILSENSFFIPIGTFLHPAQREYQEFVPQGNEDGVFVSGWELSQIFARSLRQHLMRKISQENEMCRQAKAFSPCSTFAVYGSCSRIECPLEHTPVTGPESYNIRVKLHLQQVQIYQSLHSIEYRQELLKQRT